MEQIKMIKHLGIFTIILIAIVSFLKIKKNVSAEFSRPNSIVLDTFNLSCPDQSLDYRFVYKSSGTMKGSVFNFGTADDQYVRSDLLGQLSLYCLHEKADHFIFMARLQNTVYETEGMLSAATVNLEEKSFFLEWQKTGEITSMVFSDDISLMERHLIRDLFSQISMKLEIGKTQWDSLEVDVNGVYKASYEVISESSFTKKRTHYQTMNSMAIRSGRPDQAIQIDPDSISQFHLSDGFIGKLDSILTLSFLQNGDEFAQNSTSLRLDYIATGIQIDKRQAFQSYQALASQAANLDNLTATGSNERAREQIERNALGDDDWQSISTRLEVAQEDELTPVYLKLKALFYLHPETTDNAIDFLVGTDFRDSRFHVLALALKDAGHEHAQSALLQSALLHQDEKSQIALLGQVGFFQNPSEETERAVRELRDQTDSQDIKQTAKLALGNMARAVRSEHPQRFDETLRESLAELIACNDFVDCVNALHVLGNIGAEEVLRFIPQFLEARDPNIRAVAVSALRFVELPKAEDIILATLLDDDEANVRRAAAYELSFRHLSEQTVSRVLMHLSQEPSEGVRVQILQSLEAELHKNHSAISQIRSLAQHDVSESVRQKASNILLSLGV